jgi:membrane-bound metal-dependent hydrolase YbcI (DUF457 family)
MLPPGHISAGLLSAVALNGILQPNLTAEQYSASLILGALFAFLPDLDMFYAFAKVRAFKLSAKVDHRRFFSHIPLLWLLLGIFFFLISNADQQRFVSVLLVVATWSHFLLDSVHGGVEWLWPLSNKKYALFKLVEQDVPMKEGLGGFFEYWLGFISRYKKNLVLTFYLEIILIMTAILILYFNF